MTLAFIVAYLFRGPFWKRLAIFLSSIPITVLMNSLRIGFIGITVERWGSGMAEGALHDFEGWLVFMFSTGALLLTALGLSRVGRSRVKWSEVFNLAPPPDKQTRNAIAGPSTPALTRPFAAAAALVLIGAVVGVAAP